MKDRVKAGEKLKEEADEPPIHVRSLYTQTYAKHGGTLQAAKTASEKAYAAVEKKHGTEMRDKLQAFHARNMNEETDTTEKVEMVQSQLHFIKYACEEILDYIEQGGEVEEWYQVKVAKSFSEFESLHAFIEGESRRTGMKEEVDSEKGDYDVPVTYRHKVDGKTQEVNKTYRVKNAMSHRHASNIGMKLGRRDAEKSGHNAHWMTAGWKKIEEETEQLDEISAETKASYTQKATKEVEQLKPHAQKGEYKDIAKNLIARRQKGIAMAKEEKEQGASKKKEEKFHMKLDDLVHKTFGHSPKEKMAKEEKETAPFEGGKPKKGTVTDKSGAKHGSMSRVRDIARQALKKQSEKLKTVKESLDESRKAEIVKDAVKSAKNKKTEGTEKFQSEPILSSEIMKETK
jgi:hypothetical protein